MIPMLNARSIRFIVCAAGVLLLPGSLVHGAPTSGVYRITGGTYIECCGFTGQDVAYDLPNESQTYVRCELSAEGKTATMTFLAADMRTVFSNVPCTINGPVPFEFPNGEVFSDRAEFHMDSRPPYQTRWNYTATYLNRALRINGQLVAARLPCADVPTHFSHSNVVATLITGPRVTIVDFSPQRGANIMVQGQAGWSDVLEASADLVNWTPISTNVMDFSLCPICPFAVVHDPETLKRRFYRAREYP
jgi:hypothetical protein